jgi:hypothetical protein
LKRPLTVIVYSSYILSHYNLSESFGKLIKKHNCCIAGNLKTQGEKQNLNIIQIELEPVWAGKCWNYLRKGNLLEKYIHIKANYI